MKLGELETDKNDRPLNPPNVVSVEVLWNPFDDIVLRNNLKQPEEASVTEASDLKQQKPIKPKK
jgi:peptidyl-prolyl cis-trans isomerase SDCCAG10